MDKLIKTISKNGHFRAFVLNATQTVQEAQERHQTMPSSTVALGRALIAGHLLAANEKGKSKITVKILGDGPMGAIVVVADASNASVKGYVKNKDLDFKKASTGEVLVGQLIGNGFFIVVKDLGLRQPYSGQVDLLTGEIGEDLAWYYLASEQTPSSVGVGVLLDEGEDTVHVAGGFLVQAMPDATEEEIEAMEGHIKSMPSIVSLLKNSDSLDEMLVQIYGDLPFQKLSETAIKFDCDCSKARFAQGIAALGAREITSMIEEGHGAEVICQFCNRDYQFSEHDLNDLILEKMEKE